MGDMVLPGRGSYRVIDACREPASGQTAGAAAFVARQILVTRSLA
jgi:hypothetical protein